VRGRPKSPNPDARITMQMMVGFTKAQVDGLELVDPGIAYAPEWRADAPVEARIEMILAAGELQAVLFFEFLQHLAAIDLRRHLDDGEGRIRLCWRQRQHRCRTYRTRRLPRRRCPRSGPSSWRISFRWEREASTISRSGPLAAQVRSISIGCFGSHRGRAVSAWPANALASQCPGHAGARVWSKPIATEGLTRLLVSDVNGGYARCQSRRRESLITARNPPDSEQRYDARHAVAGLRQQAFSRRLPAVGPTSRHPQTHRPVPGL